jgi:hypothetical protein
MLQFTGFSGHESGCAIEAIRKQRPSFNARAETNPKRPSKGVARGYSKADQRQSNSPQVIQAAFLNQPSEFFNVSQHA